MLTTLHSTAQERVNRKYAIDNDFRPACRVTAPLGRGALKIGNSFLKTMSSNMRSESDLAIEEREITSTFDLTKIRVWVITPATEGHDPLPAILFIHGGGFVYKGAPYHYRLAKQYALKTKSVVVYVDYRTAHDNLYSVPLLDCQDAWSWMVRNCGQIGIDSSRCAIVGDSAGGFLAINTALFAAKERLTTPAKMMLIYPVIDCSMRTESMAQFVDTPVWNSLLNRKMWEYYLQGNNQQSLLDLNCEQLQTLPQTYIESAEYDCLRDEAEIFATMLSNAGVATLYTPTKGTMHGFDIAQRSPITQSQITARCKWLSWE